LQEKSREGNRKVFFSRCFQGTSTSLGIGLAQHSYIHLLMEVMIQTSCCH